MVSKDDFLDDLRTKLLDWQDQLASLEDDAERNEGEDQSEMLDAVQDLFRSYEDIESRADEIEEMTDDEFEEELPMLEELVSDFETAVDEAREKVKDV